MAMSISDADKIIAAAERYKVKVSACHQNRFNVAVQKNAYCFRTGEIW